MSSSELTDRHKTATKTENVSSFEWKDSSKASATTSSASLQQSAGGHMLVKRDGDDHFAGTGIFAAKGDKSRNAYRNEKSNSTYDDSSLNEIPFLKIVGKNDFSEEPVSHSDGSHLQYAVENHRFQRNKDSEEVLEAYSRCPSKSSSAQSLSGHENSLGKTLANSLKLIASNSVVSPLTHSSMHSDTESFRAETVSCTSSSRASDVVTPVVVMSPSLPQAPSRRYHTRSSLKKVEKFSKRKSKDLEMMKPILSKDGSITLYQCEKCTKVFNKKQTLRQHFITHTDRFACPYCDTRCKSKGDLHRHIQTHTKEKPYHCDVCNTDYTRETILRKHMKTQLHLRACYERENISHLHRLIDNSERSLDRFMTTQAKVKIEGFSCKQCQKVTFSRTEYRKHLKSHTLKYVCSICQRGCKSFLFLKIHENSHKRSTSLTCKVCTRSFSSHYSLREHLKSHKSSGSCKAVEMSLIKAAISRHNKDITKIKRNQDASNDAKAGGSSQVVDPKGKKLECGECHKTFTTEKRLANHSRVHNGAYICGICKKAFSTVSKLKIHLKFHGQILKCDVCDVSFHDDKELEEHVQNQHATENDFTCRLCYDRFESNSDLQNHMKDHAPTMLFSGKSLEETALPMVTRSKRKTSSSVNDIHELIKTEDSSDSDEVNAPEKADASKSSEYGDESILDSQEFYEIVNSVLEESDDDLSDTEISYSDDELYSTIMAVLENELFTSEDSDNETKECPFVQKPMLYGKADIIRKHCAEFGKYSEKDMEKHIFKCILCDIRFDEEKHLKNHLICHVCEYCNKFFIDKEKLVSHKSRHVRNVLKQIKCEVSRLHVPKQKWKGCLVVSSESENELEDQFLNELEDILEGEPPKAIRSMNFLHSLSHDEIVRANKHIFEQYSCLDLTNNIFACTICKRKYARPTTLTRHFKTHVCQFCNKFFEDKSDLLEHKYRHRKKAALMKAEITGEGSKMPPSPVVSKPNRDMFKRYSFIDTDRNINRCTLCCKDFVRRTVLTRHMKTHICSHCDKFFEDKYDLAKHITFHQVDKQYMEEDEFTEYDEDEKQYSTNSSIVGNLDHEEKSISLPSSFPSSLRHLNQSFHTQPTCTATRNGTITFIQIPGAESGETTGTQVFSTPGNGASSFQIISQPVEVYKDTAPESFLVASTSCPGSESEKIITISQPQIVSSGSEERERLFECGECGKRFFKNGHLRSHMTIHTGDRPYVCRLCGKAFGRGTTLRKHEKTHMKRCKICDSSFSHKYELDLHMEIHRTYAFYK